MKVKNIKLEKQIEGSAIVKEDVSNNILKYGKKNLYPFDLLELYNNSPIHHSCIDFAVKAIIGGGLDLSDLDGDFKPSIDVTWDELFRNCALDFAIYNSFAIEIIKNRGENSYSYFHIPFEQVRYEIPNEEGKIENYYVSQDWSALQKYPPIQLKSFFFTEDEDIKSGDGYLYVYHSYSPSGYYYPVPQYISAIKSIQANIEYQNFDLKQIVQSFTPSGSIILPYVESDEEREEIIREFQKSLVGTDNTCNIMFTFRREATDPDPISFVPFNPSNGNVDLYDAADKRVTDRIVTAHRIPTKGLIGVSLDATGFSDDGKLLDTALKIYMENVGYKNRSVILDAFNNMFALNGVDTRISCIDTSYGSHTNNVITKEEDKEEEEQIVSERSEE